jgi:cysteine desulfurase
VAYQYRNRGRHIITTEVEHESVYRVYQKLEDRGWEVTFLPVNSLGHIDLDDIEKAITDQTVLLSVMHVNNEVGSIQPIEKIGQILKQHPKVLFHVDAVQSYGKIPLFPREANVGLMSVSAHKLHGPKGIGCLYKEKKIGLDPLFGGGGQEWGLRSGTQNVPAIAGFAKATLLASEERDDFLRRSQQWKELLINRLTQKVKEIRVNGDVSPQGGAPYIVSLSIPSCKAEVLLHALEEEGVYVGTKSACSSKQDASSRILLAMGINKDVALGTIRLSMGFQTTDEDVIQTIEALERVILKLQQTAKVYRK